jgi:uncharacterized protein (DUF697 family)
MIGPDSFTDGTAGRKLLAMDIVARDTLLCAVASRVPYWWANSPSVTALQLKMLSEISRLYDVEFAQDLARPLVASIAGGGLNLILSQNPVSVALKTWIVTVPVVGILLRFGTGPAVVGAYTYVLGRAFVRHYEAGGSYHDFTSRQFREEASIILRLAQPPPSTAPALAPAAASA